MIALKRIHVTNYSACLAEGVRGADASEYSVYIHCQVAPDNTLVLVAPLIGYLFGKQGKFLSNSNKEVLVKYLA